MSDKNNHHVGFVRSYHYKVKFEIESGVLRSSIILRDIPQINKQIYNVMYIIVVYVSLMLGGLGVIENVFLNQTNYI